jgi:hypothetical protein
MHEGKDLLWTWLLPDAQRDTDRAMVMFCGEKAKFTIETFTVAATAAVLRKKRNILTTRTDTKTFFI